MTFAARQHSLAKVGDADLNFTMTVAGLDFSTSTGSVRVNTDGTIDAIEDGVTREMGTWLNSGTAANFEFRMVYVSGDTFSSSPVADGEWIAITASRTWTMFKAGVGTRLGTYRCEVRDSISGLTHDTNEFDCEATAF